MNGVFKVHTNRESNADNRKKLYEYILRAQSIYTTVSFLESAAVKTNHAFWVCEQCPTHSFSLHARKEIFLYSGRKITASFVDRYK
jgi:hypothetical protein